MIIRIMITTLIRVTVEAHWSASRKVILDHQNNTIITRIIIRNMIIIKVMIQIMIIEGELGSCIAGVVSWGVGCATEGIPGNYHHLDQIDLYYDDHRQLCDRALPSAMLDT